MTAMMELPAGWTVLARIGSDGTSVAFVAAPPAEAAAILRSVNNHEALLAALKLIVAHFGDPLQVARPAIDAAEAS